jgi:hypothetical protein
LFVYSNLPAYLGEPPIKGGKEARMIKNAEKRAEGL